MANQPTLELQDQKPPFWGNELPDERGVRTGSLLGNEDLQHLRGAPSAWHSYRYAFRVLSARAFGSTHTLPSSKLEAQKRRRFSPEGKAGRVARSLAALNQEVAIRLTPEDWRRIAEDPDIEDQF